MNAQQLRSEIDHLTNLLIIAMQNGDEREVNAIQYERDRLLAQLDRLEESTRNR